MQSRLVMETGLTDVRGIGEPVSSLNSRSLYQAISFVPLIVERKKNEQTQPCQSCVCLKRFSKRNSPSSIKLLKDKPDSVRVVFVLSASASAAAPAFLSY